MTGCEDLGDCEETRLERIYEYLDGALPSVDVQEIKSHLEECPDCLEQHDLECVIRSLVKRSCTEAAPEKLKASILEKIHAVRVAN